MNDDDIIIVDKNNEEINREEINIKITISSKTNQTGRKRKPCLGLRSDLIVNMLIEHQQVMVELVVLK